MRLQGWGGWVRPNLDNSRFFFLNPSLTYAIQFIFSGSTAGSWNRKREGLSLFQLFNKCSSVVGANFLKSMMRCPSADKGVIERRQSDVSFFFRNANSDFCLRLAASLKRIKNFSRLSKKLANNTMTISDWQGLSRTLNGLVEVLILAKGCNHEVHALNNVLNFANDTIYNLRNIIEQVIDFRGSIDVGKLKILAGVSYDLDEKTRLLNGLSDFLGQVGYKECENLPDIIKVCSISYLPHIGFLVVLPYEKQWEQSGLDYNNIPGLQFKFENNGRMHYKNETTLNMDLNIGDVANDISKLEATVISRLTDVILNNRGQLEMIVKYCAKLDCVLTIGKVCKDHGWVKPDIIENGDIIIEDGRHPLQELTVNNFISNDSKMGRFGGRIQVLTGPNSSGKSVYMKQIGLICYLAHMGSFVPASSASIPVLTRIVTRIHTTESVSLGMSAFMSELNQLSHALGVNDPRSLVLVDEFGKGTNAIDGASLLAATVSILSDNISHAPFSIFSTHFHCVPELVDSYLKPSYYHMKTELLNDEIVYLYKIVEGVCDYSHAMPVARKAGVEEEVLERAEQILNAISNKSHIQSNRSLINQKHVTDTISMFLNLDLDDHNKVNDFMILIRDIHI